MNLVHCVSSNIAMRTDEILTCADFLIRIAFLFHSSRGPSFFSPYFSFVYLYGFVSLMCMFSIRLSHVFIIHLKLLRNKFFFVQLSYSLLLSLFIFFGFFRRIRCVSACMRAGDCGCTHKHTHSHLRQSILLD